MTINIGTKRKKKADHRRQVLANRSDQLNNMSADDRFFKLNPAATHSRSRGWNPFTRIKIRVSDKTKTPQIKGFRKETVWQRLKKVFV